LDKTLNNSLLARPERIVLQRLVRILPRNAKPSDLTLLAVVGGLLAGVAFALCNVSPLFLPLAVGGVAINWFGDSADSLLARVRRLQQRPNCFLFEHSCDFLAQTAMVVGLGLSPYMTLTSALMLLSLYLLLSSYTYLRITVEGVHRLSYAGLGSTEFRALIAAWATFMQLAGWRVGGYHYLGLAPVDWAIAALSLCAFVAFVVVVRQDLERIDADEKRLREIYSCDLSARTLQTAGDGEDSACFSNASDQNA
jgi:archaetidylinositol phosphate synthase